LFTLTVASLIIPSILVSVGIGLSFNLADLGPTWYTSAFGAQLAWTLPFGLLIMFAVFNRFNRAWEEATLYRRFAMAALPLRSAADHRAQRGRRGSVRLYASYAAGNLWHDHERHDTGALRTRHGHDWIVLPGHRRGARSNGYAQARRDPLGISEPSRPKR
jgi:hypothetical protein